MEIKSGSNFLRNNGLHQHKNLLSLLGKIRNYISQGFLFSGSGYRVSYEAAHFFFLLKLTESVQGI